MNLLLSVPTGATGYRYGNTSPFGSGRSSGFMKNVTGATKSVSKPRKPR